MARAGAGGRPETAAAALSALVHFLDHPSVDRLRQVLGLTSSGTVRLVDRLVAAGYLARGPGPDGRTTSVTLTDAGRAAAVEVTAARAAVLDGALGVLSPAEREAFGGPIIDNQGIAFPLADLATQIDAARLLTWRASWMTFTVGFAPDS